MSNENDLEMYCQGDDTTRIMTQEHFDEDGQLAIGIFPEGVQHHSGASATFLNRTQISDLISHLQKALNQSNRRRFTHEQQ